MDGLVGVLTSLLRETLQAPREAARRIMQLPISPAERWQALALVVILSVVLTQATMMLAPADEAAVMDLLLGSPLQSGLVQAMVLLAIVFAVHFVGRAMGGLGELNDALLLVVWLELVMVCLQAVQLVAGVVFPLLGPLIGIVGIALFFWLLTQFVMELHGFRSAVKVFLMILITLMAMAIGLTILLGLMGVTVPGGI